LKNIGQYDILKKNTKKGDAMKALNYVLTLFLIIILFPVNSCSQKRETSLSAIQNLLVGTWELEEVKNNIGDLGPLGKKIIFLSKDSITEEYKLEAQTGKYKYQVLKENKLKLTDAFGTSFDYTFDISDKKLRIRLDAGIGAKTYIYNKI
jgi:hypothetical protein